MTTKLKHGYTRFHLAEPGLHLDISDIPRRFDLSFHYRKPYKFDPPILFGGDKHRTTLCRSLGWKIECSICKLEWGGYSTLKGDEPLPFSKLVEGMEMFVETAQKTVSLQTECACDDDQT